MKFPIYFSKKIAFSKDNKNNLSRIIIFIGRLSVALGILVSTITIATGLGSKKAIKNKMGDFGGHISIKSTKSNSSYNSSVLEIEPHKIEKILQLSEVETLQRYITASGIFRNEKHFAGIILKGVGKDFDAEKFRKFIVSGEVPKFTEEGYNNDVMISEQLANVMKLKVNNTITAIFSKENQQPIYRKFTIKGIYNTDIKLIDELFVIGDINHARKIQNMEENAIGGLEVFLKDFDDIDAVNPKIEEIITYKNYAEKVTDKYPQILQWIGIFDTNISVILGIMLVVVVINIIMVLLILIIERTNSIGILKTLGATNAQIRAIFINYTLLIIIPGLVVGNIIGIALLLLQKYFGIIQLNPQEYYISVVPVDLNPIYMISLSLGILVVSAISLILPSYLISKISPAKTIKYN
ncbi:MAG: FtsX-like permease family protein [Flavobacteriaceae bacterium]|nr:FtsX-like permease family protein [Flavobacteriaceae bacterium]